MPQTILIGHCKVSLLPLRLGLDLGLHLKVTNEMSSKCCYPRTTLQKKMLLSENSGGQSSDPLTHAFIQILRVR